MKNTLLTLGFLFYSVCLFTQVPCAQHNFINKKNVWYFIEGGVTSPPEYFKGRFNPDSILIDGKYYHKTQTATLNGLWKNSDNFYREENSKLIRKADNGEEVIFDFCASLGQVYDTEAKFDSMFVSQIDSIKIGDGSTRKRINFQCKKTPGKSYYSWIEGIGDITGFFGDRLTCGIYDGFTFLQCFGTEEEVFYSESGYCFANKSKSFFDKDLSWTMDVETIGIPKPEGITYYFSKETSEINSKKYYELIASSNKFFWFDGQKTSRFFREENQKVYELNPNGTEYIHFDFSLNKGDTFINKNVVRALKVIDTDSIIFDDGVKRKRLQLQCLTFPDSDTIMWVEGIGDIENYLFNGTFCSIADATTFYNLRCVRADRFLGVYLAPWANDCLITATNDEKTDDSITVYPNPAQDVLEIKTDLIIDNIDLFDLSGKHIINNNYNKNKVDISQLQRGIYILTFTTNKNLVINKRVVKI